MVKEITYEEAMELFNQANKNLTQNVTATILMKKSNQALLHRVERWDGRVAISEFVICSLNDEDLGKSPGETVQSWSRSQYYYDLHDAASTFI